MNLLDQIEPAEQGSEAALHAVRIWSNFQLDIFEAAKDQDQHLLVEAVAGSGKTSTLQELSRRISGSGLYLAFNKAIADDARTKMSCEVKTFNALGHRLWAENKPGAQLDFKKVNKLVAKIMGDSQDHKDHGYTLARVVGLAKNSGFGLEYEPGVQQFIDLMEAYSTDIPFEKLEGFAFVCREAFFQSRQDFSTFDFDDQLFIPCVEGWQFPSFSNIFPDECQDLNAVQHEMLIRLGNEGARIVAVGDRNQAIYGFRGASHTSMDDLKKLFAMKELPLSISYRCAQSIVIEAQQFCPHIQWREGAPEGMIVENREDPLVGNWGRYMILCRTNAPLFSAILAHVRGKLPCQVMSNFLDSFQGFIRGFKSTYTSDLVAKLDRWYEREREAARKAGKRGKLLALSDKYDTVKLLCKEFPRVEDMLLMVRRLSESRSGPIFATIHKAKGLEHEHIYVLRPDQLGGFGDLSPEQQKQEDNLHYVAITRAKETLTYGATLR
jgi:DNA helicase II / ATP-dependent DNA helicase PcrA